MFDAAEIEIIKQADEIVSEAGAAAPVDTGVLAGKIKRRKVRRSKSKISCTVTSNAKYSAFEEYGTKKQDKQPYMHPAADPAWRTAQIKDAVQRFLDNEL